MDVGRLSEEDLPRLALMFRQFWGETSSIEKMRATFSRIGSNPDYLLLAARDDGLLVGFAMGVICEDLYGDNRPFMVVEDLIVDGNRRREGVGAALMGELERCATNRDCCQILFVTESDREDALRFYGSLGYAPEPFRGFKKRLERRPGAVCRQEGESSPP